MTRINTNLSSLTAQFNLIRSQNTQQQALTRLSTGLRINSGADDPSGLIAANALGSQITSINASISNSQRATNIISTADAALSQVSSLLNDIRGLVQQSANKGAISTAEIAANQVQVDSALDSITRIGQTTVFGGDKLLNGSKAFNVTGSVAGVFASTTDIQVSSFDPSAAQAGSANDVTVTVNQSATKKTIGIVGDSQLVGGTTSLRNLSLGSSTRTSSTVVTTGSSIAAGGAGLNNLSTDSTHATRTVGTLAALTGAGAQTVTFSVAGTLGTVAGIAVNVAAVQADSAVLTAAINAVSAQTGVIASGSGAGGSVTLTSVGVGVGKAANVTATAASVGGDVAAFNTAVGSLTAGTTGAAGTLASARTTTFTITGNKGSATVDTSSLSVGGFTGNDAIINNDTSNNNGITAFANLINTRTGTTGVTATVATGGNLVLTSGGVGSSSLATIAGAASNVSNDNTTINSTNTQSTTTGVSGTSNQTTVQLTGDLGAATITFNNDAVINDSGVLRDAINRVTAQTGITATSAGGNLADLSLSSQNYGSTALLTFNTISSTNAADATLVNSTSTQVATAGLDATGTVATSKGTGSFTGTGATITYSDSAIALTGYSNAAATLPTRATTTIVGNGSAGASLTNLTGAGAQTISFQLTGVVNGATVTTSINSINVAALKGDSRILVDAINKTSLTSGVRAKLSNSTTALGNIVLESTTPGSSGKAAITATAATVAGDVTVFNATATQTATTPGLNAPAAAVANFDVSGGALFQIGPTVNFQNQVTASITALDLNSLGRNVLATGAKALSALKTGGTDTLGASDLSTAATLIEQAISQIATLRGQLGALQKNVLESNITSQQATLQQVTSAQSIIQDANFAAETANLTRAQILVQAGTSVLQIANSSPQQVLSLLPRG